MQDTSTMKNPPNGGFLCYIKVGGRKLEVTVIKLTHAREQANGERAAYGMSLSCFSSRLVSLFLVSFSFQEMTLKAYFAPFYNNR